MSSIFVFKESPRLQAGEDVKKPELKADNSQRPTGVAVQHVVRWRLCSKELPKVITEKDGSVNSVLVYKKNGFECGSDIQVSNTVFLRKHPKWVTHWMPLPEPPNVES
jgi:hypothetical protein